MTFSRLRIAHRLYLSSGAMLVILLMVTAVAVIKVQTIKQSLKASGELHAAIQRYAIKFRGSAHDRSIALRDVVLSASPEHRHVELAAIAELAKFYAASAGPLEKLIATALDTAELNRLFWRHQGHREPGRCRDLGHRRAGGQGRRACGSGAAVVAGQAAARAVAGGHQQADRLRRRAHQVAGKDSHG